MDNPGPYNLISLCAGVGGLDLGVEIARPGSRTVCHVEREAAAIETLAARMEDGTFSPAPIWTDLTTFDGKPWRGVVDCLISGDPCQPNSVAGKGLGENDDRWLADHVIRIVDEIRPSRVFRENVPGNADGQLAYFIPALERLGYRIAVGIFSAAEVGFSHRRERLFIMADYEGERSGKARAVRRSGRTKRPAGSGEFVADGDGERSSLDLRQSRDAETKCATVERERGGMVHTTSNRWRQGRPEPARQFGIKTTDGANSAMGDAIGSGDGRISFDAGRFEIGGDAVDGAGDFPLAAPGPSSPLWPEIIRHAPHLEPAIRRVDARLANRVDELRAAGNGVSSMAAAFAWISLDATLAEGD